MTIPVDFNALAALRPGEGKEMLQQAFGDRWRAPAPHQEGFVKSIERRHGVRARIDQSGHLAELYFREPFPIGIAIGGLRLMMPLQAALAARPDLTQPLRLPVQETVIYLSDASSHYRMSAEFHWGKLFEIGFRNPNAVFTPKWPMQFPAPEGVPGAPFADPNFKLAVLSALHEQDDIDLAKPKDLAEFVLKRPVDLEKDGYDFIRPAYDYLVRYPLTDTDLANVERISIDGGNELYRYVHYFLYGATHDYDVKSFEGIVRCRNLRKLVYIAWAETIDAAHLVGLNALEEIDIELELRNARRLLELPALKKLSFYPRTAEEVAVLPLLRAKGVAIRSR